MRRPEAHTMRYLTEEKETRRCESCGRPRNMCGCPPKLFADLFRVAGRLLVAAEDVKQARGGS